MINPHIFREYDVRGVVEKDLTPDTVRTLGKGFGTYAYRKGVRTVMLGRDCRLSSPEFRDAMAEGFSSTGLSVMDVGICPSPLLYFSIIRFGADGGVMITGSHNPPEFNGFKLCVGPSTLYGEKIQEVRNIIGRGDFASGAGEDEESQGQYRLAEGYSGIVGWLRAGLDAQRCRVRTAAVVESVRWRRGRVEVRYDGVWTRSCTMFDSANAYGHRAEKLPNRLIDARRPGRLRGARATSVRSRAWWQRWRRPRPR